MKYSERLAIEISKLIDEKKLEELSQRLERNNILELTQAFSRLDPEKQEALLDVLPVEKSTRILKLSLRFNNSLGELLVRLNPQKLSTLLSHCDPDDAKELLHLLPQAEENAILNQLTKDQSDEIKKLEEYPKGTVGSLMNTKVVALAEDFTVDEALRTIRKHAEAEMVFYLYVVDNERRIKGVVSLRRLVTSPPHQPIRELMIPSAVSIISDQSIEETGDIFEKSGFLALPVLDSNSRLLGMVSRDDVMEQVQQETENTLFKISGVSAAEFHGAPIYKVVPFRLPWLGASMLGGILNAFILGHYTHLLSEVILLTLFIPVLLGLSETVGSQTATLIIRGLALGQMEAKEFKRLVLKEISTGFILGFLSGLFLGMVAYVWIGKSPVIAIIQIAVTLSITLASLIGTCIPMVFKKLKIDPALASSAFVLTAADLCTITVYLITATHLL